MVQKVVMILSGGMDSATLLYDLLQQKERYDVHAITFFYGQRHSREIACARRLVGINNIPWKLVDIGGLRELLYSSSLTGDISVPEGRYDDPTMKATVVPNRNMIMLSIAMGYCINIGGDIVFYGAHGGDHAIYPDCRPPFVIAMNSIAKICDYRPITVLAPYLEMSKGDILRRGLAMGVPYEETWSCYKGLAKPCEKCGACVERAEAFEENRVKDPLLR